MLTRMNQILEIDLRNRMAVVEAGVPNLRLTQALAGTGYHFAPDPSSQGASTIGGNVATNAGGPHTLKYGVTVNHVLGLEAVLARRLDRPARPGRSISAGLDLLGVLVGSEGTLAIVTKVWVRLTPNPQDYRAMRAIFNSVDDASNAVSQIIAAGIIPAAMELMDQGILAAVEEAFQFGFPPDAGAVLVIEVDGPAAGLDRQQEQIVEFCKRFGAREVLQAASAEERELLWKCRKLAVGATGRLSPSYTIQDGVVPRTRLPHIIRRTAEIGRKHQIRIVNVAHAGDGNVHPILLFDERDREQVERAVAAGREILEECIACGGSITAEHGIGVEKIGLMDRLFAPADLEAMRRVRQAFDPTGRLNPGKLIPDGNRGTMGLRDAESSRHWNSRSDSNRGVADVDDSALRFASMHALRTLKSCVMTAQTPLTETITPADQAAVAEAVRNAAEQGHGRLSDRRRHDARLRRKPDAAGHRAFAGQAQPRDRLSGRRPDHHRRGRHDHRRVEPSAWPPSGSGCRSMCRSPTGRPSAARWPSMPAGPRRYAYGTMRDYVLGFTAVDGTGTLFSGGGRVVKNAAGYNMCRLMAGSLGTLGVITQVTLMVRPLPEASAFVACERARFRRGREAAGRAGPLGRRGRWPSNSWPAPARRTTRPRAGLEGNVGRLYVGFEGTAAEVDWMVEQLQREWAAAGVAEPIAHSRRIGRNALAVALPTFPADVEIRVLPSAVVGTIGKLLESAPPCAIQAHAGDGVIRLALWNGAGEGQPFSETHPLAQIRRDGGRLRRQPRSC